LIILRSKIGSRLCITQNLPAVVLPENAPPRDRSDLKAKPVLHFLYGVTIKLPRFTPDILRKLDLIRYRSLGTFYREENENTGR
jgi:hypothetical protein